MSANALVRGSRTSALLNVLEPSPGVSQLLPAQPSKRHARTVSSQCGNDFLHLPPVHVQTFPSNWPNQAQPSLPKPLQVVSKGPSPSGGSSYSSVSRFHQT